MKSSIRAPETFCYTITALVMLTACHRAPAVDSDPDVWSWHEPLTELHDPSFSSTGGEIAVVRKRHVPDGHGAEMLPGAEREEIRSQLDRNERYADPEVVLIAMEDKRVTPVGWGWAPAFSPDDRTIAFSHQVRPASRLRILASTLAGNEIHAFDRGSGRTQAIATPKTGFFTDPFFTGDGESLVYSMGDAVNGAWPGTVGIGLVDLSSGSNTVLHPPTKDFGFFQLIDLPRFVSGRLLALRSRPTTANGGWMANAYSHELVEVGPPTRTLYTWSDPGTRGYRAYGPAAGGGIAVFDGSWRMLKGDPGAAAVEEHDGDPPGEVSPDGRWIATHRRRTVAVLDATTGAEVWSHPMESAPLTIRWSPNSMRLALVVSRYRAGEVFVHDELHVVTPRIGARR